MLAQDFAPLPERITFTVDVEDAAEGGDGLERCRAMVGRLLEFLTLRDAVATFFVVGDVAERSPGLVREIAAAGHEIASHSYRHTSLAVEDSRRFRSGTRASRRLLEDLAGTPVLGFRAPLFSLTPATAGWALDALAEAGFAYSSSIVPGRAFRSGWAGAPSEPFRWPGGLLELPCPVGKVGPFRLPFLGGMYLRYLPPWRLRQATRNRAPGLVWTYCHPYDFDTDEPFRRRPGQGWASSFFLWWNRGLTLERLDLILRGRRTVTFRDLCPELAASAVEFGAAA
jgi:polysaccharide deacetylase family protein (PEP-CTERM system associated)